MAKFRTNRRTGKVHPITPKAGKTYSSLNRAPRGSRGHLSSQIGSAELARMQRFVKRSERRDNLQLFQRIGKAERYSKMTLFQQTDPKKLQDGEYRYTVTGHSSSGVGIYPVTAFHTKEGLDQWMRERNIKLTNKHGWTPNITQLNGSLTDIAMSGNAEKLDAFGKQKNYEKIQVLSNGEWTTGYVKRNKRGGSTVYYLNPNYPRDTYRWRNP